MRTRAERRTTRASYCYARGTGAIARYLETGEPRSLDEAIHFLRRGRSIAPPVEVPHAARHLADLSTALRLRWVLGENSQDLAAAIEAGREALEASTDDDPGAHPGSLLALATALYFDYVSRGDRAALEECLCRSRDGAALDSDDVTSGHLLSTLAAALSLRFEVTLYWLDAYEALEAAERSLSTLPEDHPDQAVFRTNLALVHTQVHAVTGQAAHLESAISAGRQIVETWPGYRDLHLVLSNLGQALRLRLERGGDNDDGDRALAYARDAVRIAGAAHPNAAMYRSNLAAVHVARFRRWHATDDLDGALVNAATAVDLAPAGHPLRRRWLSNLAAVLHLRSAQSGGSDLNRAIAIWTGLVDSAGPSVEHAVWQTNLADALATRYEQRGDEGDLARAIDLARLSVTSADPLHPQRAKLLFDFVQTLSLSGGDSAQGEMIDRALEGMRSESGAPALRLILALTAAKGRNSQGLPDQALDIYAAAITDLLPKSTWHGLAASTRQRYLSGFPGIGSDAAATALSAGQQEQAIELLEGARTVQWTQSLRLTQGPRLLREKLPEVAARLVTVGAQLNADLFDPGRGVSDRALARSWEHLLTGDLHHDP